MEVTEKNVDHVLNVRIRRTAAKDYTKERLAITPSKK